MKYLATAAILMAIACPLAVSAQQHEATGETVYQMADGLVMPSRFAGAREAYLPIVENSNHAANLLALPDGDLLCFWFAGTWEGRADVSIAMSRLNHGSDRWTLPVVISTHPGRSDQNPVPFLAPDGRIWLFHTSQKGANQTTAIVYKLTSDDQGHTWTKPSPLFTEPGSFVRQRPVVFDGAWLFPIYRSASKGIVENAQNDVSIVKISKDNGKIWTSCEVPGSGGLVQMNIVEISAHQLLAFFRSRYADWIYRSSSSDGCHWSTPLATQLPNNNASIQVTPLADGHLVMAFNNLQATTTRGAPATAGRTILSVALSTDEGKTWPYVRDVQSGLEPPRFYAGEKPEYAYPSVTQSRNGLIQLAFTFRRATIKYMEFPESWIKGGGTAGTFKGDPKP
jgi:predicted neuraminidase